MTRTYNLVKYAFLGLFAIASLSVWGYQLYVVAPRQKCEAAHKWWSARDRMCATPVSLSTFTGKPNHPATAAR